MPMPLKLTDSDSAFMVANYPSLSVSDLAGRLGTAESTVIRRLKSLGIYQHREACTESTKREVIRLYVDEKRGKKHIGKIVGKTDVCISNWLREWGIPSWDRKTIQKKAMAICGPTKGFSGKSHSAKSRIKTSIASRKSWDNNSREAKASKSATYETEAGKVLGKWEVAYVQSFKDQGLPLPTRCRIRIKTPFGTYQPDFEESDCYIEIKSRFTLDLANGKHKSIASDSAINQMRKIKYVSEYVKPVKIVVIEAKDANSLFKKAQAKGGILL